MEKTFALSLSCLIAFAAFARAQAPLKTAYYPLEIGQRWTYRHIDLKAPQGKAGLKRKVVIQVERDEPYVEKKTGKDMKVVEKKYTGFILKMTSGDKVTNDHVVVTDDGIRRVHVADTAMTPPLLIFKLPLTPGDTWKCESTSGNTTIKGTFTSAEEQVSVPMGDFKNALRISFRSDKGDKEVGFDSWFVQNIGMVKQRVRGANFEIWMELEKFEKVK